jgi:hypothetical protein
MENNRWSFISPEEEAGCQTELVAICQMTHMHEPFGVGLDYILDVPPVPECIP